MAASSKTQPIKAEYAKLAKPIVNVKGVIFSQADYLCLEAWRDAGYPSSCIVRDTPYWLMVHNIPITDAVEVAGVWRKGVTEQPIERKPIRRYLLAETAPTIGALEYVDCVNMILPNAALLAKEPA
jgi:hypothetical protein